jgi:hypothetical protein
MRARIALTNDIRQRGFLSPKANPWQTPSHQTRPEECCPEEACTRQNHGSPPFEGNAAGLPCSEEVCTEAVPDKVENLAKEYLA